MCILDDGKHSLIVSLTTFSSYINLERKVSIYTASAYYDGDMFVDWVKSITFSLLPESREVEFFYLDV